MKKDTSQNASATLMALASIFSSGALNPMRQPSGETSVRRSPTHKKPRKKKTWLGELARPIGKAKKEPPMTQHERVVAGRAKKLGVSVEEYQTWYGQGGVK